MNHKTIGIIGGMGPLATADLFQKIVQNTKASCDQEHIRIFIDNNTNIPDRTAAILGKGEDPLPQLRKSAAILKDMGADLLIMPCNTAHYFYKSLQESIEIPVLHMIEITRDTLKERGIRKAGLLATDGTRKTGIYQDIFEGSGIELICPEGDDQKAVMDMIYAGVKAGNKAYDTGKVKKAIEALLDQGAETIILGCTELPLAVSMYQLECPCTDPTLELAKGAIKAANYLVLKD